MVDPVVPANRFWAKLYPRESPSEWHPLIAHSADVAAVLERLVHPSCGIGRRLAGMIGRTTLTDRQQAQLVFAAALHDIGKTSHGFQTKAGRAAEDHRWRNLNRGHVQVLLNSLHHKPLRATVAAQILPFIGIETRAASDLFCAIIAHHGRPHEPRREDRQHVLWQADPGGRAPLEEIERIVQSALVWSNLGTAEDEPLPDLPPTFSHLFAGALTLADWIGSTRAAFPLTPWADEEPDRYWILAQEHAAEACARIGVVPRTTATSAKGISLLEVLFPDTFSVQRHKPTELQEYASQMPLPLPGSRLLIESETGSGKTEAAIAIYARLRAAGLVSGLMFALPTRGTASAMYDRIRAALIGMYRDGPAPTVALAVGGNQPRLDSNEEWAREKSNIEESDDVDRVLESWASSHNKKYLAAEIVVGTLDQVLLGGLPVKHAHLRLAALSRHLLVVDELHSFDRYMTAILTNLLEMQSAAGGISLFMSATLSSTSRHEFAGGATLAFEEALSLPYPTLSICPQPGSGWRDHSLQPTDRPKKVSWSLIAESEVMEQAVEGAAAGARVCILCNTVRRARAVISQLKEAGHEDLLWRPGGSDHAPPYHSRYALPDRLTLDESIRHRFGKEAADVSGGVILVSTQVVEQSLDVDFDMLITDLCPIDVLLQRIGRLHRHARRDPYRSPEVRYPRALVVAPEGGFSPYLKQRSLDLGWGEHRPYPNFADGELTMQAMAERPEISIPNDNRFLVESVYHPEKREPLWDDENWSEYLCKAESEKIKFKWMGDTAALRFDQTYTANTALFDSTKERAVRTRLGDETLRIELPHAVRCWYSEPADPVYWVDLPTWALPRMEDWADTPPVWIPNVDGITEFRLGDRIYRYGSDGWDWRAA